LIRAAAPVGLALMLGACASPPPLLQSHLPSHLQQAPLEIEATPFYPQTLHQCGPAALAATLGAAGVEITPEALAPQVYLPARQGSLQTELVAAVRRHGRLAYLIEPGIGPLLEELQAGRPVLVLQNLGTGSYPFWHYAVVIGYRPDRDQVVLRSGTTRREVTPARRFLRSWQLAEFWGLVVLRPGELPAVAQPDRYLRAVADLESTGQTAAARLAYAEATRRWPDNATAWLGLGNTEFKSGRLEQAEHSYRQSIRAAPGYPAAYNNLSEVQARRGCLDAALMTIGSALALPGEPAQRLRGLLVETRREIIEKRPPDHIGDPTSCGEEPPVPTGFAGRRSGI
jgi:tetratricopeptide (TPR) repeat protein